LYTAFTTKFQKDEYIKVGTVVAK